jgi:hypothetical protein
MSEPARAAVIVVNWNGRQYLERCLAAVFVQPLAQVQVILVDNGSTDDSCAWVAAHFPQVRIIALPRNTGFAVANNIGIRAATAPYVILLNNDTEVQPGWLEALIEPAERDRSIGMCAARVLQADRPELIDSIGLRVDALGFAWQIGRGQPAAAFPNPIDVFGPSGAAALYRGAMLDQIGLLDEDFESYYEDVDLAWRAHRAGWRCRYVPQATVLHVHSATSRRQPDRKIYLLARNRWWTIVKNYPAPRLWLLLPFIVIADGLSLIRTWLRQRNRTAWTARRDAARGVSRMWAKRSRVR